jgi:iron(III) transport system permease protein
MRGSRAAVADARTWLVSSRRVRWVTERLPRLALLVVLAVGIVVPAVYLIEAALSTNLPTAPVNAWTLDNLRRVYTTRQFLIPMRTTAIVALSCAVLTTAIGFALAVLFNRAVPHASGLLRGALMAPLFISPLVSTVGWVSLLAPNAGLLNDLLDRGHLPTINIVSVPGAVFVLCMYFTPYAFVFASDAIDRIGADVYEAAEVAGARPLRTALRVTLPLLAPALVSAFVLVFVLASEIYSVPSILTAPDRHYVLSNVIFTLTTSFPLDYNGAAAAGTLLLVVATLGLIVHMRATRTQGRFATQTGKAVRHGPRDAGRRARATSTAIVWVYVTISVILPLLGVILRSAVPFFSNDLSWHMFTAANFRAVYQDPSVAQCVTNSLKIAGASMVGAVVIGGLVAYTTVRHVGPLSRIVQFLANLPLGLPGTILALGLIWTYIGSPVYNSIYIVGIAIFAGWLPIVTRVVQTAVLQSSVELEDAADIAGAPLWRRLVSVAVPQIRTSLFMGALLAFVFAINEVSAAAILTNGNTKTLSVLIYDYMQDGQYGYAAVLALGQCVLIAVVAGLLLLGSAYGRPRGKEKKVTLDLESAATATPAAGQNLVGTGVS